jgi:hypothetical protein
MNQGNREEQARVRLINYECYVKLRRGSYQLRRSSQELMIYVDIKWLDGVKVKSQVWLTMKMSSGSRNI